MKKLKLNPCAIALTCLAFVGANNASAADRHVPADYATIQAAVNAAVSGDTIRIAAGVYVEQTWITNKNLTLVGQPGTILRAFPGMLPGIAGVVEWRCILFVSESENVVVRGLTFEGEQMGDQNGFGLMGVDFDVAGGSVENCRFTGFREATPGSKYGKAVQFWNGLPGAARFQARVTGNIIEDCYSGIGIFGTVGNTSYDVAVINNKVTGVGLTTAGGLLEGIHLGDGTVGTVARNTVSGFAYEGAVGSGAHEIPFGILRVSDEFPNTQDLEPMTFEENILLHNQVHLAFFKANDSVVRNNTFDGHIPFVSGPPRLGGKSAGLWASGVSVQVVGNLFRDLEQGIRLAGDDSFGIATDAMLINNRYCDVATQVSSEPGASFTEQGALTCPFPDPVMKILSWPGIEEGFSVQSAPTSDGPWRALDITPIRQNGENRVVVPTAADQQFFRLFKP